MKLKLICGAVTVASLLVFLALKQVEAANSFYNASGAPAQGATLSSSVMRTEFANIGAGFDKMPTLTANTAVVVNGSGTALTNTVGTLALAGNFATTGTFNTTLVQQATTSLTLPAATDTIVGRASTDTLTNKTISGASNTLTNIGNASLTNSAVTIAGHTVSLGGSTALAASDLSNGVTGSGAIVLATSPTLTTPVLTAPNLGTPSAVTLTNGTGLPISTGVSGLGTGVATFLATPSSANLLSALTTKTGTGSAVFSADSSVSGIWTFAPSSAIRSNGITNSDPTLNRTDGVVINDARLLMRTSSASVDFGLDSPSGVNITFYTDNGSRTPAGTISSNGSTTSYNTSSDQRLKNNIADAGDPGAIIDALRVRQWDWKTNGSHEAFGFVAQEEVLVAPFAVTPGDADPVTIQRQWARDDSKLVPLLVKEIQSLRARVAVLEAR